MSLDVHDQFNIYRKGGTGLSVTLVGIAGSLIYWEYGKVITKGWSDWFVMLEILILAIVIFIALGIQYATYYGYKWQARSLLLAEPEKIAKSREWKIAQKRFSLCFALPRSFPRFGQVFFPSHLW